jgi:hypothetical protein
MNFETPQASVSVTTGASGGALQTITNPIGVEIQNYQDEKAFSLDLILYFFRILSKSDFSKSGCSAHLLLRLSRISRIIFTASIFFFFMASI